MYMLDTNICIYIKRHHPPQVLAKLNSLPTTELCMSSVTYAELYYGAIKSQQAAKNLQIISALTSTIAVLAFDVTAAEHYGVLRTDLENRGLVIGSNDLLIAAHARSGKHILVSNNLREFARVTDLITENWV